MHACKDYAESVSVKSPVQLVQRRVGATAAPPNTAQTRNVANQEVYVESSDRKSDGGTTDSEVCLRLAEVGVYIHVFCIVVLL